MPPGRSFGHGLPAAKITHRASEPSCLLWPLERLFGASIFPFGWNCGLPFFHNHCSAGLAHVPWVGTPRDEKCREGSWGWSRVVNLRIGEQQNLRGHLIT